MVYRAIQHIIIRHHVNTHIKKNKPQPATAVQRENEKGMIPKDKGVGDVNLGLWGETHVLPLFWFAIFLVSFNLFIVLLS